MTLEPVDRLGLALDLPVFRPSWTCLLDLPCLGLALSWTCLVLDLPCLGLALSWTCLVLDCGTSWTCLVLDLPCLGLALSWTCLVLDLPCVDRLGLVLCPPNSTASSTIVDQRRRSSAKDRPVVRPSPRFARAISEPGTGGSIESRFEVSTPTATARRFAAKRGMIPASHPPQATRRKPPAACPFSPRGRRWPKAG